MEYMVKRKGSFFLILYPKTGLWFILDGIGYKIFGLYDKKIDNLSIAQQISNEFNLNKVDSQKKVEVFLAKINKLFDPSSILTKDNSPYIETLEIVDLEVTKACNLRCIHCFAEGGFPRENELSLKEIIGVIQQASELKVGKINITGGEPLLHKNIWEIIKYAKDLGFTIEVLSNGTLIDRSSAEQLGKLGIHVQVSLDGATKEIHESVRGEGSFEKTLNGIKYLIDADVEIDLALTILRYNMDHIKEFIQLADELDIKRISINTPCLVGRINKYPTIYPNCSELAFSMKQANEYLKETGKRILIAETGIYRGRLIKPPKRPLCFLSTAYVSSNGDVYPCGYLVRPEFNAGNIRDKTLKSIFYESKVYLEGRKISLISLGECKECELISYCCGGCRANALSAQCNFYGQDPLCEFYRDIFDYHLWESINYPNSSRVLLFES